MVGRCSICQRTSEATGEFCTLHNTALRNLESQYLQWNEAFGGNLTKADYYTRVLIRNETGSAAKKLIEHLQQRAGSK